MVVLSHKSTMDVSLFLSFVCWFPFCCFLSVVSCLMVCNLLERRKTHRLNTAVSSLMKLVVTLRLDQDGSVIATEQYIGG